MLVDCISDELELDLLNVSSPLTVIKGAHCTCLLTVYKHVLVEGGTILAAFIA